jgi:hypothetical protein
MQRWAVDLFPGLHGRIFDPSFEALTAAMVVRKYAKLPEHVQEFCRIIRQFVATKRPAEQS